MLGSVGAKASDGGADRSPWKWDPRGSTVQGSPGDPGGLRRAGLAFRDQGFFSESLSNEGSALVCLHGEPQGWVSGQTGAKRCTPRTHSPALALTSGGNSICQNRWKFCKQKRILSLDTSRWKKLVHLALGQMSNSP